MDANRLIHWRFIYGKPADFWLVQVAAVERFIKANRLRPVAQPTLQLRSAAVETAEKMAEMSVIPWWWKYGGIRVPHLHFEDQLFMLSAAQWKVFSAGIVKDFSKKLAEANAVSFGQLMDLSEAVNEVI